MNPSMKLIIVSLLCLAILGSLGFWYLAKKTCVPEHGGVRFGIGMIPTGKCCEGLIIKAPEGFVGGGFCMRPECEIEYKFIGTESEGLYDSCDGSLIKYKSCKI